MQRDGFAVYQPMLSLSIRMRDRASLNQYFRDAGMVKQQCFQSEFQAAAENSDLSSLWNVAGLKVAENLRRVFVHLSH